MKYITSRIVIASDIGLNNNLFGAKLLEWIDSYGSLFTYKYLHHKFVTYKMEKTYFLKPAKEGDCLDFYATNIKFSPISVNFDLFAKNNKGVEIINTNMTFVAIDVVNGTKQYINPFLFEQEEFEIYIKQKAYSKISTDENIFHNISHIEEMLTQLNMYKQSMSNIEYKRLYAAICYHDIIHDATSSNNKEHCVEQFKRDWYKAIDNETYNIISEYILATKYNKTTDELKEIKNADLIHDLNMLSFIDYECIKSADIRIKFEYSHLTPIEFYTFRLNYFKDLLKSNVFISSKYKKYNTIAAENIKQYINEIEQLMNEFKDVQNEKC